MKRCGSPELLVEIFRLPDPVRLLGIRIENGFIDDDRCGGHPFVEGRRVDQRLEGRSGLPAGLGRTVEFAALEIAPAHHRPDGAGLGIHGEQRPLDQPLFIPLSFLHLLQAPFHRLACRFLHLYVQRRVDLEALFVKDVAAVFFLDVAADVFDEVGGDFVLGFDGAKLDHL